MHSFILRLFALLFGLCVISNALAIPATNGNSLAFRQEGLSHSLNGVDVERRASKKKPPTTPAEPPKQPAEPPKQPAEPPKQPAEPPKQPTDPKNPTKPSASKTSGAPKSATSTSATASPTASAVDKLPPWKHYVQRAKKAYNVCSMIGFGCVLEDYPEDSLKKVLLKTVYTYKSKSKSGSQKGTKPAAKPASGPQAREVEPRAPRADRVPGAARSYKVGLESTSLNLESKPYWTGPELYDRSGASPKEKVYANFKTDIARTAKAYEVGVTSTKPAGADFVTEHILELQTIKKFIESVTRTSKITDNEDEEEENDEEVDDEGNVIAKPPPKSIQLKQSVDGSWFTGEWNRQFKAKMPKRPKPATSYPVVPEDASINNIVFEALGSKTNVEDFVLCEAGINSVKGKLWSYFNPFNPKNVDALTRAAAASSEDSGEYLTLIRTVMAVYDYMELPQVEKRLKNEIDNVAQELSKENLEFLLGADRMPKDPNTKQVVDLAQMWRDFMVQHDLRFREKGLTWLDTQLKLALKLFGAEEAKLDAAKKKLAKETQKETTARIESTKTKRKEGEDTLKKMDDAKKLADKEQKEFEDIKKEVDKLKTPEERKQKRLDLKFQSKVSSKTAAKKKYETLQYEFWTIQRDLKAMDPVELPKEIKAVDEDVAVLKAFQKKVTDWTTKLATDQLANTGI